MKKNNKVSIDNLILFCVFLVREKNEKCSFERLVKECFDRFPETFSLGCYLWPDSRKLDRPLRFLKSNGLIKIESKKGFALTNHGSKKANEINSALRQEKLKI